MIRKDNGSNNSLFLSCQMGLSDGAFFMIKHTPLPNGNHPILSHICPMGVATCNKILFTAEKLRWQEEVDGPGGAGNVDGMQIIPLNGLK